MQSIADARSQERETAMSEETQRKSAQIFQFPAGGRATLSTRREAAKPVDDLNTARFAKVAFGSSWYHEEAIQEADKARKH
jgi:hypothetical protein